MVFCFYNLEAVHFIHNYLMSSNAFCYFFISLSTIVINGLQKSHDTIQREVFAGEKFRETASRLFRLSQLVKYQDCRHGQETSFLNRRILHCDFDNFRMSLTCSLALCTVAD